MSSLDMSAALTQKLIDEENNLDDDNINPSNRFESKEADQLMIVEEMPTVSKSCPVCFETMQVIGTLNCGHSFCPDCITEHLN
jgi:hypothetical protein